MGFIRAMPGIIWECQTELGQWAMALQSYSGWVWIEAAVLVVPSDNPHTKMEQWEGTGDNRIDNRLWSHFLLLWPSQE